MAVSPAVVPGAGFLRCTNTCWSCRRSCQLSRRLSPAPTWSRRLSPTPTRSCCQSTAPTCRRINQFFVGCCEQRDGGCEGQVGSNELPEDRGIIYRRKSQVVECGFEMPDRRRRRRDHTVSPAERLPPPKQGSVAGASRVQGGRPFYMPLASWGELLCSETWQSGYAAAMATAARVAFLVSSLNLISIAGGNGGPKGG
jgi:hypothetical protein